MNGLLERVERLERSNRRMKLVLGAVLLAVGFTPLLGARFVPLAVQDEIRTRALAVVDEAGQTRVSLGVEAGVSFIRFHDAGGSLRVSLGEIPNGAAVLVFADANEETRAALGLGSSGSPMLVFYDGDNNRRMELEVFNDGSPSLRFLDKAGVQRAVMVMLDETGSTLLALLDSTGRAIWGVPR